MRSIRYALALLAGMVLGLGTPPIDAYPALWLGMVAFAWLLDAPPAGGAGRSSGLASRVRSALTGAMRGLAFGVGANLVVLRFVPVLVERFTSLPWAAGLLGLVLLSSLEGLRWMIAGVACEMLARARVPRPLALAAGVYAGTFLPTMLPWTVAGLVSPWPEVIQLADVVGERGVAALMALTAGLAAGGLRAALDATTRRRGLREHGGALVLVAAQVAYGQVRMRGVEHARASAPHARLGLVQPDIAALARWDEERGPEILEGLTKLTLTGEQHGAQIVVWPETAYPYRIPHDSRRSLENERAILQPGVHVPIITGVQMRASSDGVFYNSVVVATANGAISEPYDKRHLLWFGETVPLAESIPWIKRTFARGLGLVAGDHSTPLVAGPVRAAALVCYEDMLPEAGREAIQAKPNLLVNVTNDAWFKGTEEPELHLRVSVPRTVELRRDMVRAVNQGPTSWVDAEGRVRSRAAVLIPSTMTALPALLDGPPTLYARWGDVPWALAALLIANAAVWRAARRS
jgi:apolipoprotein N-acyltransferase